MIKSTIAAVFIIWYITLDTAVAQDLSMSQKRWIGIYSKKHLGALPQWSKVMGAMAKVESDNGRDRIGKYKSGKMSNCYGLLQLKPSTARDIMSKLKMAVYYTDEQLIDKLKNDDRFNIQLASAYIGFLWELFNDLDLTVISYNIGQGKTLILLREGKQLPVEYLHKVKIEMERIR